MTQTVQKYPKIQNVLGEETQAYPISPDIDFIRNVKKKGGGNLKKCFQCGTCSVTCDISPSDAPFPRKEMLWASWGLKERLLKDPDIWLCHQCNDCSAKCPRGAHPGDTLAAIRQEVICHYAVPHFLGQWVSQPRYIPLLLGIPALILACLAFLNLLIKPLLQNSAPVSEKIMFASSNWFPHWLLNVFFGFCTLFVVSCMISGIRHYWKDLTAFSPVFLKKNSNVSLIRSFWQVFKSILNHNHFETCTENHSRFLSHFLVVFGFLSLLIVTFWVITARFNPLLTENFVYPFNFWNPIKILANVGGIALLIGSLLMFRERLQPNQNRTTTYADWAFLVTLLLVLFSGFLSEILHYVRLTPHRHFVYFIHLVFVFALLMYLPYSKFAHIVYRTTALTFAELCGRKLGRTSEKMYQKQTLQQQEFGYEGRGL